MSTVDPIKTETLTYFLRPGDAAPARPAALYLALFTADPGTSGAATNELAAGGYARQVITFDAPAAGETQDAAAATFGPAGSGGWPSVTHVAVCAGSTAGVADLLYVGALQTPQTVAAGQSLRFDPSELLLAAGDAAVSATPRVLAASGTRLFSYVVGNSLTGATVSRASIATYRDANGVLQTAAADVARDAHYEGATRTLLLEGAATNVALYSDEFENAAYTLHNLSGVTADSTAGPDGAMTADKFVENTSAGSHGLWQDVSGLADDVPLSVSCWVKPAGRGLCYYFYTNKDGTGHLAWLDLTTGQFGTETGEAAVFERAVTYQNGWYRIEAIGADIQSGTTAPELGVKAAITDGSESYTGDGTSGLYLAGFQAVQSRLLQSFIPTTGSVGGREADLIGWGYGIAPQESSGLVAFNERGAAGVAGLGLFSIGNDEATGPRLWIETTGSGYQLVHDNETTQVASSVATTAEIGDAVALRWVLYDDGSVELFESVNGGAEVSGGRSAANALASAWGGQTLRLNSIGTASVGSAGYTKCVVDAGVQSFATLDTAAIPAAPSALSATVSGTTVTLTWTDNATNEEGFHIYRKYTSPDGSYTDPDWVLVNPDEPVPSDTAHFDDTGLTAGATYHYEVTAFNAAGDSSPSNSVDVTVAAIPAAPTNLAATASGTTATLVWTDNATNEGGFHVYRKYTSPDGSYTDPSWVLVNPDEPVPSNTTRFDDTGLAAGATYHYYVAAFNAAGESAPSNTTDVTMPTGTVPAAPTGLTATAVSANRIDLSWTDNATNETGYDVYRSTVSGFDPSSDTLVQSLGADAESWSDQTVIASTTYYYRVLAVNDAGASSPSNEAGATTPATPSFTNEPAGMTLIADEPWVTLPPDDYSAPNPSGFRRSDPNDHLSLAEDATAPMSTHTLNYHYPQYFTSGSGPGLVAREQLGVAEVFVATNVWISPGAKAEDANVWKLWYLFQEVWSPSYNRQATILALRSNKSDFSGPFRLSLSQESAGGGVWLEPNVAANAYPITTGAWHRIEVYMKRSSGDGVADGVFRLWVDGVPYSDYTTAKLNDDLFTQWHVDPVWGGLDWHDIVSISGANPAVVTLASALGHDPTGEVWRIGGNSNSAFNGQWVVTKIDSTHVSIPTQSAAGGTGGTLYDVMQQAADMRFNRMYISGR